MVKTDLNANIISKHLFEHDLCKYEHLNNQYGVISAAQLQNKLARCKERPEDKA